MLRGVSQLICHRSVPQSPPVFSLIHPHSSHFRLKTIKKESYVSAWTWNVEYLRLKTFQPLNKTQHRTDFVFLEKYSFTFVNKAFVSPVDTLHIHWNSFYTASWIHRLSIKVSVWSTHTYTSTQTHREWGGGGVSWSCEDFSLNRISDSSLWEFKSDGRKLKGRI